MSTYGKLWEEARVIRLELEKLLGKSPADANEAMDLLHARTRFATTLISQLKQLESEMSVEKD